MPETDYLKIPQNRVGALIGSNGNVKKSIEKATGTILDIDSDEGTVYITPRDDMEDPLGVWNANHIVKAVARGFNPEVALKLVSDDIYLEVISLPLAPRFNAASIFGINNNKPGFLIKLTEK